MEIAYGDQQVSQYAAAVEARTIGASAHEPALDPSRSRDKNLLYGIPAITQYPFAGSAIVLWDGGPGQVQPPPFPNLPPVDGDRTTRIRTSSRARRWRTGRRSPTSSLRTARSSTCAAASRATRTPTCLNSRGLMHAARSRPRHRRSSVTRVAVVGHVEWVDFVEVDRFPQPGTVVHAPGSFARAGGGGGVVTGVLADLEDVEVEFFVALGRDAAGEATVTQLTERGAVAPRRVARSADAASRDAARDRRRANDHHDRRAARAVWLRRVAVGPAGGLCRRVHHGG